MSDSELLDRWARDAAAVRDQVAELFQEHSEAKLTWKPSAAGWSIAECVDHLAVTGEAYYGRIGDSVERVKGSAASARGYRPRWLARLFLRFVSPEGTKRVKAPKRFQPGAASAAGVSVGTQFVEQQQELIELIERARDCDLNAGRFGSPVTSLLRFSIGEALQMMVFHQQRHLAQMQRVLAAEGCPK